MTQSDNARLLQQIRELCGFLPRLSQRSDLQRLRSIYERGNTHMLESENLQRIVNEMRQHARELRKLSHVFAVECRANLARHAAQGSK